jgi:integrase/recombinase XerD
VSDRVIILKRFFGYLLVEGHLGSDPAQRLPMPKIGIRLPKALTLDEMKAFFSTLSSDSVLRHRDRILFEVMYAGGLRVSEAAGLRVGDIDFTDGSVRVLGKGDRERRIYLKPRLIQLVREHIESEQVKEFLFPGRNHKPMTARAVELRIKRYAKAAGIARLVTPHTLRHSIAVHYLQGGAPVNFVQGLLGHASLATTDKYLQLTDQMTKEIALKTETALDRVEGTRESRAQYRFDTEAGWDMYVAVIMEWLAAD